MADKILGTMKCPVGAIVRTDDGGKFVIEADGFVDDRDKRHIKTQSKDSADYDRRLKALVDGRKRCPESGPVSTHSTDKGLVVVLCPIHGAVEARADIWTDQVK